MIPQVGNDWQAVAVQISVPTQETGWTTDIDFRTTDGMRRIRFTTSAEFVPVHAFLYGFDAVHIIDNNAGGANCLAYGRYFVEVLEDDESIRFLADRIIDVSEVDPKNWTA